MSEVDDKRKGQKEPNLRADPRHGSSEIYPKLGDLMRNLMLEHLQIEEETPAEAGEVFESKRSQLERKERRERLGLRVVK